MSDLKIGMARARMNEKKRAYELAKSDYLIALEAYEKIMEDWWREAIRTTEKAGETGL